ncbi:hypothetical protein GTP46_14065 [Duganella sp. FT135W]|uniref:Uncharacterized protein n=1 Tax=Duganella flavida TaxID=2692175 RepID=A0A6L8K9R3_9BURK|nr:hypothetical protein [Duganella flavida]MYM23775.1 hypothetical protein [Duganella flavida]
MTTATDIEALADQLSASANALHVQLMRAIRNGAPREHTQALFEDEIGLRTQADSLYLDAAHLAAAGLAADQQTLLALTARATDAIARIDRFKDLADLAAELLTLAAALAAGKPDHVLAPLEQLKHHLDAL